MMTTNTSGNTPLFAASFHGVAMLRLLVEHGGDINVRNDAGLTTLSYLLKMKGSATCSRTVQYLLEQGIDVGRCKGLNYLSDSASAKL